MGSNPIFRSIFQIQNEAPGCPWGLLFFWLTAVLTAIHMEVGVGIGSGVLAAAKPSSKRSAAASWSPGVTWLYMSKVVPTLAWPRRSWTIFGWTPCRSISVAWAWRASCSR